MHYDRRAFTKNGLPTIERIDNKAIEFGPSNQRLSQKDIIEINALYDCISSKLGINTWPCRIQELRFFHAVISEMLYFLLLKFTVQGNFSLYCLECIGKNNKSKWNNPNPY